MGKQKPIFEFEPKTKSNVSTYVAPSQKKSLVMSGIMELEQKQEHARFRGEILFCHGYLADPLYNEEGHMNALFDLNPDDPEFWTRRGENADESDHTNPDDFYTEDELEKDLPRKKEMNQK